MTGIVRILTCGRRTIYARRLKNNALKCRVYRVHGGEMTVSDGRSSCRMTAGNVYLLPNSYCGSQEAPFFEGQFFDVSYISFIPAEPILFDEPVCFALDEHPALKSVLDGFDLFVETYSEKQTPENLDVVIPLLQTVLGFMNHEKPFPRLADPRLEAALAYLHEDLTRPVTVEELAAKLYLHPNSLIRLFRENLSVTPHRYQLLCRLAVAENLLRSGSSVTEAAAESGFDDLSLFSRAFRKAFGQPPSAVRSHRR